MVGALFKKIAIISLVLAVMPSAAFAQATDDDVQGPKPMPKDVAAQQLSDFGFGEQDAFPYKPYDIDELQSKIDFALKQNDADTQYVLGRMYENGDGVSIDYQIAVQWYEAAVESGHLPSMVRLARIYLNGAETVRVDTKRALNILKAAEKTGNPIALYELGNYFENGPAGVQNFQKAYKYYVDAAKAGIVNAHIKLGIFFQYGYGVNQDIMLALKHYNLLADITKNENVKNYIKSIKSGIYDDMAMKTEDPTAQFKWTRIAAEEGSVPAMVRLGDFYRSGIGTEINYKIAAGWYVRAAKQDNPDAMTNLGYLYMNGYGVNKDFDKAREWFRLSAEQGDSLAAWNIGNMYLNGYGVKADKEESDKWFARSEVLKGKKQK